MAQDRSNLGYWNFTGSHLLVFPSKKVRMLDVTTCLWFDKEGEEAAKFYCSVFKNSRISQVARYEAEGAKMSGQPEGSVMTVAFELDGHKFLALNGGQHPNAKFNDAISIVITCDTQDEIDEYWQKLTADGGQEVQCGWLKDKYGLSWQITPRIMEELQVSPDRARAGRAMKAMGGMKKMDIEKLRAA